MYMNTEIQNFYYYFIWAYYFKYVLSIAMFFQIHRSEIGLPCKHGMLKCCNFI